MAELARSYRCQLLSSAEAKKLRERYVDHLAVESQRAATEYALYSEQLKHTPNQPKQS